MMHPHERLKAAWCFLSLDRVANYFRDLWIPVRDASEFQTQLRTQLEEWLTEVKYHKEGEALSYSINTWCEREYGGDTLDLLLMWAREIYLFHGPDRVAETAWKVVPYCAGDVAGEFSNGGWIFELMTKLKETQDNLTLLIDNKLDEESSLSSWDASVLSVQYGSEEGLERKINLIASYNIFLEAWETHCSSLTFEELRSVFEVAKRVAEVREMQDWDLVFPGSWRPELRNLLSLFT